MRIGSKNLGGLSALVLLLTSGGCGSPDQTEQGVDFEARDENGAVILTDGVEPPEEYYSAVESPDDEALGLADTKNVLYLVRRLVLQP